MIAKLKDLEGNVESKQCLWVSSSFALKPNISVFFDIWNSTGRDVNGGSNYAKLEFQEE